jgi:hypothetical protein
MTRARDNAFNPFNNQVAGKNFIINGAFDFWQRGNSFTLTAGIPTTGTYTADRWSLGGGGVWIISRETPSVAGSQYALRLRRNTGSTATGDNFIVQTIESANVMMLAGKTLTLSFNLKKGSDFSGTGVYSVPRYGTGTDEGVNLGYNGGWSGNGQFLNVVNPTTTSTRYSYTFTLPSTAKELMFLMGYQSQSGTATANDWIEFEQIQLELGSSATQFSRAGGTIGGELSLCQRYYYRDTLEKHLAHVRDTNLWFITKTFPVRMRSALSFSHNLITKVTPGTFPGTAGQIGIYSNGWVAQNATALSCSSDGGSNDHGSFYIVGFNGTLGQVGSIQSNGASYFEWNAEL